jgi:hypothetical protein
VYLFVSIALKHFILCRYSSHHSFLSLIFLSIVKQDGQCTCKRNTEAPSSNQCCRAKAVRITHSECVFLVYVIQQAKRMRCIILPPVACLAVPYYIATCGLSGCTVLYCHLWPVWLYRIILPPVVCLAVPYFSTLS